MMASSSCPASGENWRGGLVGVFIVPVSGGERCRRSRWRVQRARLRKKKPDAVTLGCSTCPSPEENWRGGHVGVFNVPVSGRKSLMRSRRSVQRARLRKKKSDAVTQERSTCPSPEGKARCGHAGACKDADYGRKSEKRTRNV